MRLALSGLAAAILLLTGVWCVHAQEQAAAANTKNSPDENVISGKVEDASGTPVAGAAIEYWVYDQTESRGGSLELKASAKSTADGKFSVSSPAETLAGVIVSHKAGFAPAWRQVGSAYQIASTTNMVLTLSTPGTLEGVVVDEADKPVADVPVMVANAFTKIVIESGTSYAFIGGEPAKELFAGRTDSTGRFKITNFPTNSSASFSVKAPGKALRLQDSANGSIETAGYRVGEADIKLVVEPAGRIDGKVVAEEEGQRPATATLMLVAERGGVFGAGATEPVTIQADGTYRFEDVAAGTYRITAKFGTNEPSDWVATNAMVTIEAGQKIVAPEIKASRGGALEVAVVNKNSRKPMPKMNVGAFKDYSQASALTDSDGLARFRLVPGDYQIAAFMPNLSSAQSRASVELGKTNRVEIEIAPPQKLAGIVRTPDGKPANGVWVRFINVYSSGERPVKTDSEGKFEMKWNQSMASQHGAVPCILARDVEHNWAVAQDIEEEPGALNLTLAPAVTIAGKALFEGKPITNATAKLVFWSGNSGMWLADLAITNKPGEFEIPALPPGRKYGLVVTAPGYGQQQVDNINDTEAGRHEVEPVELKLANLKVSGQVVDADDKPVAGAWVNLHGNGQPSASSNTDRKGRFTFDSVCEGTVQISANQQNSHGSVSAEGGETNVIIRMGQNFSRSESAKANKLKGKVTDAEGHPMAGAQLAVFPNSNGQVQWTKADSNGVYNLTWSLEPWQERSGAILVARDLAHNLAITEDLSDELKEMDVQLLPALTLSGVVKNAEGAPMPGAQVEILLKAGNTLGQYLPQPLATDKDGHYEIKGLPVEASFYLIASAKGFGRCQRQVEPGGGSNQVEMQPFELKPANHVIAGQVLDEKDRPASGIYVNVNGDNQPSEHVQTDSKGRFKFKVCEGQVRLYASGNSAWAQATAEADDTNVVINLRSNSDGGRVVSRRASLKGNPLPDLTSVSLEPDAAPAGQPVLLCLFDAAQRPSRRVLKQLNDRAAALHEKSVCVLGVQAVVTSDDVFDEWKTASPVTITVGRIIEKTDKNKWVTGLSSLPWLILTDANHKVVAEGFPLEELDAQIEKIAK